MSRSVIIPSNRSPSVTGIAPASVRSMKLAASRAVWSGRTVWTSRVITSLTFMRLLLCRELNAGTTNSWRGPFLSLRHVLGQKVIGGDQFVPLVEDLHRPANNARVFALQRLGADGELHPHGIPRVEGSQEAEVL